MKNNKRQDQKQLAQLKVQKQAVAATMKLFRACIDDALKSEKKELALKIKEVTMRIQNVKEQEYATTGKRGRGRPSLKFNNVNKTDTAKKQEKLVRRGRKSLISTKAKEERASQVA